MVSRSGLLVLWGTTTLVGSCSTGKTTGVTNPGITGDKLDGKAAPEPGPDSSSAGAGGRDGTAPKDVTGGEPLPPPVPGASPTVANCPVFPPDSEWNRDVSQDPVDPDSAKYLANMNAGSARLHPDFGSNTRYGIPWVLVAANEPKVPMSFRYADESDPGPYPFAADVPIEGGPDSDGDRHIIAIDRDNCRLYEAFRCFARAPGWSCDCGAIFDLRSNKLRPDTWTSADAAGLPIFAGLIRRDEIVAGEIRHALRFTVVRTQRAFVHPATHYASSNTDSSLPPMGLRVRLKADYDLSRFQGPARVVLTALKKYGMFLADNGGDWYVTGEMNAKWNDDEISALKSVPASAFEVVKLGKIFR